MANAEGLRAVGAGGLVVEAVVPLPAILQGIRLGDFLAGLGVGVDAAELAQALPAPAVVVGIQVLEVRLGLGDEEAVDARGLHDDAGGEELHVPGHGRDHLRGREETEPRVLVHLAEGHPRVLQAEELVDALVRRRAVVDIPLHAGEGAEQGPESFGYGILHAPSIWTADFDSLDETAAPKPPVDHAVRRACSRQHPVGLEFWARPLAEAGGLGLQGRGAIRQLRPLIGIHQASARCMLTVELTGLDPNALQREGKEDNLNLPRVSIGSEG